MNWPTPLRLIVLGATGSIGQQTLDLVSRHPDKLQVAAVSCHGRYEKLALQLAELRKIQPEAPPPLVAVCDEAAHAAAAKDPRLSQHLLPVGAAGLIAAVENAEDAHCLVNGLVGAAGLPPTLAAAARGLRIALANKESLVVGGDLVAEAVVAGGAELLPVDSEHAAIAQCLSGRQESEISRLILTASGGPFRETPAAELAKVSLKQVLNHPTWQMGPKITVDSATLMNKGLEVIEAHHLFGVAYDDIEVVVHPGSIVHSMVEFADGAILAQMGTPDMRVPLQYAISGEKHWPLDSGRLDFLKVGALHFEAPDLTRFPCLRLAMEAGRAGGTAPIVLNAANEVAVAALLAGKIQYAAISGVIEECLNKAAVVPVPDVETAMHVDDHTRKEAVGQWTGQPRLPIEGADLPSNLPITIFAFLLTLGLVVVVHELGHFLFCKLFGVYVKTFSIGIGPKFLRKRWGETEYVLSAIPFGGYVKMAGEGIMEEIQDTGTWEERKYPMGTEEGNAEAAGLDDHIPLDRHFHSRPAWQRFLVFVAGPLFNLVLSFVIYTLLVMANGLQTVPFTQVGEVEPDSPAAVAGLLVGDQIISVGGEAVETWSGVTFGLIPESNLELTATPPVEVIYERESVRSATIVAPVIDGETGRWNIGLRPWNTTVGLVQRGGPADKLGLKHGDVVLRVGGQTVTSFGGVADIINDSPDTSVLIEWDRNGQMMSGEVTPELTEVAPGVFKGRIFMEPFFSYEKVGVIESLALGFNRTGDTIEITVGVLAQFVQRKLGLDAVGGPLRIGQAAGSMLRWSFSHLMYFVAFFSINLFLLNLMPIPVLDGGHVFFLVIEVLRGGKPVPERWQAIATQVGLIILLLFMTFVVVLDVWKVTGH